MKKGDFVGYQISRRLLSILVKRKIALTITILAVTVSAERIFIVV